MIIKKPKAPTVEFGELSIGDVFIEMVDGEEYVQMKITPIQEADGTVHNSVGMEYGVTCYTSADRKVYRVVAELNIL